MLEAVVMESYAYSIYLFDAAMLVKLVTRAYANGEREPKGPATGKKSKCEDVSELTGTQLQGL